MDTYEQFLVEKILKSVNDVRKGKTMETRFPSYVFQHFSNGKECFALTYFILPIKTRFLYLLLQLPKL